MPGLCVKGFLPMTANDTNNSPHQGNKGGDSTVPAKMPVMLALFDVLGFSKRLEDFGIEKVLSTYQKLINDAVLIEPNPCLGARDDGGGGRVPTLFTLPVEYAYFSDTILLWVPLEKLFASPFVWRCANLVCEALQLDVPLRGALALGDAIMHKSTSTYIGPPIVEAAKLESAQKWIGMAFCYTATWSSFLAELDPKLIIEYDVPAKESTEEIVTPVVLDWPRRWRELSGKSANEKLSQINESSPHPYCDATMAFVDYSEKNQDWFGRPEEEMKNRKLRMRKRMGVGPQEHIDIIDKTF